MRGPITKTCDVCRETFTCGQYRCWCGSVGITERQMDWIAARFTDCLCETCLRLVAAADDAGLRRRAQCDYADGAIPIGQSAADTPRSMPS